MRRIFDAIVLSGLWVAFAAAGIVAAVSYTLGTSPDPRALSLAFAGTFAIYAIDRLRDHQRDAERAPMRSAFVLLHRRTLRAVAIAAAFVAAASAFALGSGGLMIALAAGMIGLLHRRLKDRIRFKAAYITVVWLLVVVGLPVLGAEPTPATVGWICAILGPPLLANAIAFSVRDEEALVAILGRPAALAIARIWALAGLAVAGLGPPALRPLGAIPLTTLVALLWFRDDEHYAHVAVDGALLVGALLACVLAV